MAIDYGQLTQNDYISIEINLIEEWWRSLQISVKLPDEV